MNQKEVVKMLLDQAKIEPGFTELGNGNLFSAMNSPLQLHGDF